MGLVFPVFRTGCAFPFVYAVFAGRRRTAKIFLAKTEKSRAPPAFALNLRWNPAYVKFCMDFVKPK